MSTATTPRRLHATGLFPLGQVVATPGAVDLLERTGTSAFNPLRRHQCGDWGSVPPDDAEENLRAIKTGSRILSSYFLNDKERLWIITEADRSATTLLLPEEY